jgi:peptidyl-prolyl cis-trans isomerase C
MPVISTPIEIKVTTKEFDSLRAVERGAGKIRLRSRVRHLSHQPLVHFLIAGLLLFTGATFFESRSASASRTIQVTSAEVQRLKDVWSRQYGRNPSAAELNNLVAESVREEIYYREAIASGLDKGDSIIRRRLVEKMEFLSQEIAAGDPSDNELQEYFLKNRGKFEAPAQAAFVHIFFSPAKHGSALDTDVQNALRRLRSEKTNSSLASQLGDPFMLQSEYPPQSREEVKALFGDQFAHMLFAQAPGQWAGPIKSSYGVHLVRIEQFKPAHVPESAEIRSQLVTAYKNDRLQTATEAYYAGLRKRYSVKIDDAAVQVASGSIDAKPRSTGNASPDED